YGRALGYERLYMLQHRDILNSDYVADHIEDNIQLIDPHAKFAPGSFVIRTNEKCQGKFDTHYKTTMYHVISGFRNGTYILATMDGKLLKRK
ncbi:hypothetical protein BJV82DRAFT_489964, partial [Fennellomyces sp. T-0311]